MKKKRYIVLMVIIVFFMINSFSFAGSESTAENEKYYMTMAEYKTTINEHYEAKEDVDFYKSDMYPDGGIEYHPWIIGQNIEGFHEAKSS